MNLAFYHITTGTKQLLMSCKTFCNKELKIFIPKTVFWISRNMLFVQKGLRKEGRLWRKEDFHTKGTFYYITTGTSFKCHFINLAMKNKS